ncbi:MAG TPA: DUF4288 domain-containing protein [Bacteroidia bacterium]|jgi:hypothetical protein|nr:DUF4288 domain-containing protein [Bacteroidia bacterium]
MNLYLSKLVFNISIDNNKENQQFDEQTRIIEANNLESAFLKAKALGKKEEETFFNEKQQLIAWKFIDVTELYALKEFKDGEQIFSNTHETMDGDAFIKYIHEKSMVLQTNFLTFA